MSKKEKPAPILDEKGRAPLKLNYPQTFKVGLAFAIIIMFWNAYDFVVPLLLENAYGLPNAIRGLIMGLDNLLSLFMLPLFGKLSDNAKGKLTKKFGRRTPFIVLGTIASVLLMVFVPVATLKQQEKAISVQTSIEAQLNDDAFMNKTLTEWYDNAVAGKEGASTFCDLGYLDQNKKLFATEGMSDAEYEAARREFYTSIRSDEKMTSKKAILNLLGDTTYYYDGVEVQLTDVEPISGKTYQEIVDGNANYKKFVAAGMNNHISDTIYNTVTTTKEGLSSLAVYMVILLLVLIAMATFRSPAVALMPDVTPKPLRSQANAIINLCGGIGGAVAFLIYTVVLFGERLHNYVIIFASVGAGMLLLLAAFLALVNERKLVAKCQEICKEYEIDDFAEGENEAAEEFAKELIHDGDENYVLDEGHENVVEDSDTPTLAEEVAPVEETPVANDVAPETLEFAKEVVANQKKKHATPKEWWAAKGKEEQAKFKSFILILASIFMWFMGYNAISSNLSVYTTKALNLSAGIASIISGVSMGVSAIAFIPVGYLAAKIGRRKSIMIGFAMAVVSFVLVCAFVTPSDKAIIPSVLFSLFYLIAGFGLIIANVNTFPMVTELSTAQTVGQYTGYYYVATMSAQAITPALGGLVMDYIGDRYIFVYSAICIVIAIVLMAFVKHGDSVIIGKGKKLSKEEKKQIRLDAMDSAD